MTTADGLIRSHSIPSAIPRRDGGAVPFGQRADLGAAARESGWWEFFAEELRLAHTALGAITGEFTADDLLGQIFSRFCIGK